MELLDSRRLTGANAVSPGAGAVIDVAVDDDRCETLIAAWQKQARKILDAVGWSSEQLYVRRCRGGASLALSAPIDALYAATEVNEWALAAASGSGTESLAGAAARLQGLIAEESNPSLRNLQAAAFHHGRVFLSDDDEASIGLGRGSKTWPVSGLPQPDEIDWSRLHEIPVGLVTGTNGKTTSVRLAAGVARAAGLHVGYSSTDWLAVDDQVIDPGDYAGPGGARTTLRNRDIDIAILETARGGLLRRGIGVPRAQAALITRIARDHIGDFGSANLDELLDAKWVVSRALGSGDRLVLNADDPLLVAKAPESPAPVVFFSLDASNPVIKQHVSSGGQAWALRDEVICECRDGKWNDVIRADEIPLTLGGAARHNIANALGVAALCESLGIGHKAIVDGLAGFAPDDNPGRGNLFDIDGVKVLVDFAHNPDALRAIVSLARNLPARRRLIAFGEAGDRTDALIQDLADIAWQLQPDRLVTLEIAKYARGREPGELKDLLHDRLTKLGARRDQLTHHQTEVAALHDAMAWAQPGDLVILLSLAEQDEVLAILQQRGAG
ncbi:MAG: Mur ligase [Gammaproteobacteria bacterium]|nr:Mur ligase [Gammaproteobacteria bacterium]